MLPPVSAEQPSQHDRFLTSAASSEPTAARSLFGLFRKIGYLGLNLLLLLHLVAIISAPLTIGPSSATSRRIWDLFSPYLQVLYLNHGFHYFAPEPGSSNLVSWTVTRDDGSTLTGRFPNFEMTPRLLYHRHFMLSEVLGNSDPQLQSEIARGFARNLLREHNAAQVSLSTIRHDLSSMVRVRVGGQLTDPDLYTEQPLGSFTRKDFQ
jgi:hypothetical protein